AWKLKQSPLVKELYAAPGNAGIATVADCVNIGVADVIELADFADGLKMDLTIVGPELPLTLGIVDEFQKRGLPIFGPTRLCAGLEGSKIFSKEFMRKYGIPTAEAVTCGSADEARAALKKMGYPSVLKVDGLAAGKGAVIVKRAADADEFLRTVFDEKKFGNAANRILVEEMLTGDEVSFMAITDGKRTVPLAAAKDYKTALDGDMGPNTGGMGAQSAAEGVSGAAKLTWRKEAAACVVIAVEGYPDDFTKGQEVAIDPTDDDQVMIFHGGTIPRGGKMINVAGRVASVCARGATLTEALVKAYMNVEKVRFEGARYRRDIGYRALENRARIYSGTFPSVTT